MNFIFTGIAVIVFLVAQYFVIGFAISQLWQWFIVPQFNLPTITVLHGLGISGLYSAVQNKHVRLFDIKKIFRDDYESNPIDGFLTPTYCLVFGYVIQLLIKHSA